MASPRRDRSLLVIALLQGGCEVHSVCFLCDDTDTGSPPELALSAEAVEFGEVAVGDEKEVELVLYNTGGATLSIVSAEIVGSTLAFRAGRVEDMLLQPGERTTLDLEFAPERADDERDELVVDSDDPVEPMRSVSLTGEGTAPVLVLTPDHLDFGTVQVGCTADESLVLTNAGNMDLRIESVELETTTDEIVLELDTATMGPLPWSLVPAQGVTLGRVSFTPLDASSETAFILLRTNDPVHPRREVEIQAQAGQWGRVQDTWTFPSILLDVVLAVDTSYEMDPWIASFVGHSSALTTALDGAGATWRLAVVAADDGCVEGRLPYLASGASPAEVVDGVRSMLDVRPGVFAQQAFVLLDRALSDSALDDGGCNARLRREGAGLHLVGMSSAEEGSAPRWTEWVARFQDLVGDPADVAFHGMGSDPDDPCPDMEDYARFHRAALATGGSFVPLCTLDWDASLSDLATAMIASAPGEPGEAAWPLSALPVPGTLRVQVDGTTLSHGWTWSEAENVIRFEAGSVPRSGSTVSVSYAVAGPCQGAATLARSPPR